MPRDFVPLHKFSVGSSVSESKPESGRKPLTSTERSQLLSDQPGNECSAQELMVLLHSSVV